MSPLVFQTDDVLGRKIILQLLAGLQSLSPALDMHSHIGNGPLLEDVSGLIILISSKAQSPVLAAPLLQLVIKQANDEATWSAVFELIDRTRPIRPTTPPPSAPALPPFKQTPWSHNTGGLADTSELRSQMNDLLKQELEPSLRLDVPDLQDACFGHITGLNELANAVFDRCQNGDAPLYKEGVGWVQWPSSADEELVLTWLMEHTKLFAEWARVPGRGPPARQISQGPGAHLSGSTAKRKMDVGITTKQEDDNTSIKDWGQILVAGELKSNADEDNQSKAWLDLATYVREVFRARNRRFVLAFSICGSVMRLWHFDRLGNSASQSFNLNEDGYQFVYVMLGYFVMDSEQLGLDPTIGRLNGDEFVEIVRTHQNERLILTNVLRKQAVIVGRATTCWRAYREGDLKKQPLIVKDSWQYVERPEEGKLIKEATETGVKHIARYYHHETVQVGGKDDDITTNVRRDRMKTCSRTSFRQLKFGKPDVSDPDASGKILAGRLESQSSSRKRSSSSIKNPSPTKRSRSSQQSGDEDLILHNRFHRRVVTRDAGKPVEMASSLSGLLNGMIGAIKGAWSKHDDSLSLTYSRP